MFHLQIWSGNSDLQIIIAVNGKCTMELRCLFTMSGIDIYYLHIMNYEDIVFERYIANASGKRLRMIHSSRCNDRHKTETSTVLNSSEQK